jgi:hypothetical protein
VALVPHKQGYSEVIFKLANLAAERRLGNVELLRRFTEIQILGDRKKIPDVTQFHKRPSILYLQSITDVPVSYPVPAPDKLFIF